MQLQEKSPHYHQVKDWVEQALSAVIKDPVQLQTERRWFIESTLGISAQTGLTCPDFLVDNIEKLSLLETQLSKRIDERLPIQYILGESWFYGLKFTVTPDVLIPRPETEILVETALAEIRLHQYQSTLDLATGSGCIAISLKKNAPTCEVTASDISKSALKLAQDNATLNNTEINCVESNWFAQLDNNFDLICCNPPYIHQNKTSTLAPEVLCEPHTALFAEIDPVLLYQQLISESLAHLNNNGQLLFELEETLFPKLRPFLDESQLHYQTILDYAGIVRHLQIKAL